MPGILRGECHFDPSPEIVDRFGLREHIDESEKVYWIGKPTGLSYMICNTSIFLFYATLATFFIGYQTFYYDLPRFVVIIYSSIIIIFFLEYYALGNNICYFISSKKIGMLISRKIPSFYSFLGSGLYICPIKIVNHGVGTCFLWNNLGNVYFGSMMYNIKWANSRERPDDYHSQMWLENWSKYFYLRRRFFLGSSLSNELVYEFVGIGCADEVVGVLKKAVGEYWTPERRQIEIERYNNFIGAA